MMKTTRIILNTTQHTVRIESLLNLIKKCGGTYIYYKSKSLYYIMVETNTDDLFPFDNLEDFFGLLKYSEDDSLIVINDLGHILNKDDLEWARSEVQYKKIEEPSEKVLDVNFVDMDGKKWN